MRNAQRGLEREGVGDAQLAPQHNPARALLGLLHLEAAVPVQQRDSIHKTSCKIRGCCRACTQPRSPRRRGQLLKREEVACAAEHLGEHTLPHVLGSGFQAAAVEKHVFPAGVAVEVSEEHLVVKCYTFAVNDGCKVLHICSERRRRALTTGLSSVRRFIMILV